MAESEQQARRRILQEYGIEESLDFTAPDVPDKPIMFRVNGEMFYVRPWLTGIQFLEYSEMLSSGGLSSVALVKTFFTEVMESDEHERFIKFISDPANRITTKLLSDIFLSLWARYSAGPKAEDRPMPPSRPSEPGRDETEDTSKENSSSEESTPQT